MNGDTNDLTFLRHGASLYINYGTHACTDANTVTYEPPILYSYTKGSYCTHNNHSAG